MNIIGNHIRETFKKIHKNKKGEIFNNDSELNSFVNKNLNEGDYLMVKGSNSTGLFNFTTKLKKRKINAL